LNKFSFEQILHGPLDVMKGRILDRKELQLYKDYRKKTKNKVRKLISLFKFLLHQPQISAKKTKLKKEYCHNFLLARRDEAKSQWEEAQRELEGKLLYTNVS